MLIGGLQKCSLLDFHGKIAAIIFTQGCNFRCPFCHNASLVLPENFTTQIDEDEVFWFLRSRQNQLDGIVITGGEPTIHKDLEQFIDRIRELRFAVKLDTNGTNPAMLQQLIDNNKLDYIAMDVKHSVEYYKSACGSGVGLNIENIINSIKIIINSEVDYEFRTTIVPDIHTFENTKGIRDMIMGTKRFVLQKFIPEHALSDSLRRTNATDVELMERLQQYFSEKIAEVLMR